MTGVQACALPICNCSLRAALDEARLDHGPSTVTFAIPGAIPHQIQLSAQLPSIDENDTVVDGYTQPGSQPNTSAVGSNAVIGIEVRGNGPRAFSAFYMTSDRNTIRGLAIFSAAAKIKLRDAARDNRIVGNFLGTDASGTFTETEFNPNGMGVSINDASDRNRIGTPALADRNVVAGNSGRGVSFFFDSSDNLVQNNVVGLSPTGIPRGNFGHGVDVNFGSSRNLIGGTGANERNVVAANHAHGIEISHELTTVGNRVVGNYVGTRPDGRGGNAGTGNWNFGIHLEDHSNHSVVEQNVVAYNRRGGITLQRTTTDNIVRDNVVGVNAAGQLVGNEIGRAHV